MPLLSEQPSSGPRGTEPAAPSPHVQWGAMGTVPGARDVATRDGTKGHPEIPTSARAATPSLGPSTEPRTEQQDRTGASEELAMGISQGVLHTSPWHTVALGRQCCSSGTKSLSSRGTAQWKERGDHEH